MSSLIGRIKNIKKMHLQIGGVVLLILLAVFLLWFSNFTSWQAVSPLFPEVYFEGEYSIAGGSWQNIAEGEHISSTQGDVTLRGNFHMLTPDGEYVGIYRGELPIAFYVNHINLTFYKGEEGPYIIDMENPLYGNSACGENWTAHYLSSEGTEEIRIILTWGLNPLDLDSHLEGPGNIHTWYNDLTASVNGEPVADLDLDDTDSYGPETTTIRKIQPGVYYFYVHNYSTAPEITHSGAQVKVYQGSSLIASYNVPSNVPDELYWNVFKYDSTTGTITPNNTITSSPLTNY